jgi:hypothetical protein
MLLVRSWMEVIAVVVGFFAIAAFKVVEEPFPEVESAKTSEDDGRNEESPGNCEGGSDKYPVLEGPPEGIRLRGVTVSEKLAWLPRGFCSLRTWHR